MGSCRTPYRPTACALIAALLLAAPARALAATPDDPWESFNRGLYAIHQGLDHVVFGPAARAYTAVLPKPLRKGLRNLINNLKEPGIAFNDLLQAHPTRAGKTTARFLVNSSVGVGGLFDMAFNMGLPHHDNGFGTTAARYSIQPGPYLFIPFIGPSNIRDLLGQIADTVTDPLGWQPFRDGQVIYARAIIDGLDQRAEADAQLQAIDNMSTDPYASLRSLYEQNRAGQVQDAIAGAQGAAEPQFGDFDDVPPAPATPDAPLAPPADPAAPAAAADPRPGAMLENRLIDRMLDRPLALLSASPRAIVGTAPVESPRAG
jgi:phospholipid-binding lipoprotein MlaA